MVSYRYVRAVRKAATVVCAAFGVQANREQCVPQCHPLIPVFFFSQPFTYPQPSFYFFHNPAFSRLLLLYRDAPLRNGVVLGVHIVWPGHLISGVD